MRYSLYPIVGFLQSGSKRFFRKRHREKEPCLSQSHEDVSKMGNNFTAAADSGRKKSASFSRRLIKRFSFRSSGKWKGKGTSTNGGAGSGNNWSFLSACIPVSCLSTRLFHPSLMDDTSASALGRGEILLLQDKTGSASNGSSWNKIAYFVLRVSFFFRMGQRNSCNEFGVYFWLTDVGSSWNDLRMPEEWHWCTLELTFFFLYILYNTYKICMKVIYDYVKCYLFYPYHGLSLLRYTVK